MNRAMTGHRQRVLHCLTTSIEPLSALDLYRILADDMNLATIYRALPVLEQEGLIEGLTVDCSHEGTTRFYLAARQGHRHFFHCMNCHKFFPLEACGVEPVIAAFQRESGHQVLSHTLSLVGTCRTCVDQGPVAP